MDKLIKWLENSFAPKLQKITNLTWIVVIKDSMMQLLPFILAGSIFCVGTILNDYIPALPSFCRASTSSHRASSFSLSSLGLKLASSSLV